MELYAKRMALKDSICKFGEKYDYPKRLEIDFLSVEVDDNYKIRELHRAIPQSDDYYDGPDLYYYFFIHKLTDYDPISDSLFMPEEDNFLYKLKDVYFFDINGDGKLDFIHYPRYYSILTFDNPLYFIFIQTENGYKRLNFTGSIADIKFDKNGILNEIKTFQLLYSDGLMIFIYYTFDADKNELLPQKSEKIWLCQFKEEALNK